MKFALKTLYIIALTVAFSLPVFYSLPGWGVLTAAFSLLLALSMRFNTLRDEGAHLIGALTAATWCGTAYMIGSDAAIVFILGLLTATGLMALAMILGSAMFGSRSEEISEREPIGLSILKAIDVEIARAVRAYKKRQRRPLSHKFLLKTAFWACLLLAPTVLLSWHMIPAAILLNLLALVLALTWMAEEGGHIKRIYSCMALAFLIGAVAGQETLGALPWVLACVFGLMALFQPAR